MTVLHSRMRAEQTSHELCARNSGASIENLVPECFDNLDHENQFPLFEASLIVDETGYKVWGETLSKVVPGGVHLTKMTAAWNLA